MALFSRRELKEGDRVEVCADNCSHGIPIGKVIKIHNIRTVGGKIRFDSDFSPSYLLAEDVRLENKTNNMSLKSIYKALKRTEPELTFHKAGVINDNDDRTEEGTELFLDFLFAKHGAEFKKEVVDGIVSKMDEEKKD